MGFAEFIGNLLIWINSCKIELMSATDTGNQGEELACKYLQNQGYKILKRNYRIRGGEIDIVSQNKEYLVFVEVKTRYSHEYGLPSESMTPWKIKYLLKTAKFYLQEVKWMDRPYRLDFISIDFASDKRNPQIELVKNITG